MSPVSPSDRPVDQRRTIDLAVVSLGAALVVFFAAAGAGLAAGGNVPTAFWAAGGAVSGGLLGLLVPSPLGPGPASAHSAAVAAAKLEANRHASDRRAAQDAVGEVRRVGRYSDPNPLMAVLHEVEAGEAQAALRNAKRQADHHRGTVAEKTDALSEAKRTEHLDVEAVAEATGALDDAKRQAGVHDKEVVAATTRSQILETAAEAAVKASSEGAATATPPSIGTTLIGVSVIFFFLLALTIVLAAGVIHPGGTFGNTPLQNVSKATLALAAAAGNGLIGVFVPSPSQTSGK